MTRINEFGSGFVWWVNLEWKARLNINEKRCKICVEIEFINLYSVDI